MGGCRCRGLAACQHLPLHASIVSLSIQSTSKLTSQGSKTPLFEVQGVSNLKAPEYELVGLVDVQGLSAVSGQLSDSSFDTALKPKEMEPA